MITIFKTVSTPVFNDLTPLYSHSKNYMELLFDSLQHCALILLVKCLTKNYHCHHNVYSLKSTYFEPHTFHVLLLVFVITLQGIFHHLPCSSKETKTQSASKRKSKNSNLSLCFQSPSISALLFGATKKLTGLSEVLCGFTEDSKL